MNLCSENHEEVCHDERNCPLCAVRDDLQSEIDARDEKIRQLEADYESLKQSSYTVKDQLQESESQ